MSDLSPTCRNAYGDYSLPGTDRRLSQDSSSSASNAQMRSLITMPMYTAETRTDAMPEQDILQQNSPVSSRRFASILL